MSKPKIARSPTGIARYFAAQRSDGMNPRSGRRAAARLDQAHKVLVRDFHRYLYYALDEHLPKGYKAASDRTLDEICERLTWIKEFLVSTLCAVVQGYVNANTARVDRSYRKSLLEPSRKGAGVS